MKRRVTAILLTFAMVVTALPTTAFVSAEELEVVETIAPAEAEAVVDGAVEDVAVSEEVAAPVEAEAPAEDLVVEDVPAETVPGETELILEDGFLEDVETVDGDAEVQQIAAATATAPADLNEDNLIVKVANTKPTNWETGGTQLQTESGSEHWYVDNGDSDTPKVALKLTYNKTDADPKKDALKPAVGILYESSVTSQTEEVEESAYTVEVENNNSAGKGGYNVLSGPYVKVTFKDDSEYTALRGKSIYIPFTIEPGEITTAGVHSALKVVLETEPEEKFVYDGKEHNPNIKYLYLTETDLTGETHENELYPTTDYSLGAIKNEAKNGNTDAIQAGVKNQEILGKGNYKEAAAPNAPYKTWTIEKRELQKGDIKADPVVFNLDTVKGSLATEIETAIQPYITDNLQNGIKVDPSNYVLKFAEIRNGVEIENPGTWPPEIADVDDVTDGLSFRYYVEIKDGSTDLNTGNYTRSTGNKETVSNILTFKKEGNLVDAYNAVKSSVEMNYDNRAGNGSQGNTDELVYTGKALNDELEEMISKAFEGYKDWGDKIEVVINGDIIDSTNKTGAPYKVTIKGIEDSEWEGQEMTVDVYVQRRNLADDTLTGSAYMTKLTDEYGTFTADRNTPVKVTTNGLIISRITDKTVGTPGTGTLLKSGTDYTVNKKSDEKNGDVKVEISGAGNYVTMNDKYVEMPITVTVTPDTKVSLAEENTDVRVTLRNNGILQWDDKADGAKLDKSFFIVEENVKGEWKAVDIAQWDIAAVDGDPDAVTNEKDAIVPRAGEHTVTIAAHDESNNDKYAGSRVLKFRVQGKGYLDASYQIRIGNANQTVGSAIERTDLDIRVIPKRGDLSGQEVTKSDYKVTLKDPDGNEVEPIVADPVGEWPLETQGIYTITVVPVKDGTWARELEGKIDATFTVGPKNFTVSDIELESERITATTSLGTVEWTGSDVEALVEKLLEAKELKDSKWPTWDTGKTSWTPKDGRLLKVGKDYTITLPEEVSANGKAFDVTLTGMGDYKSQKIVVKLTLIARKLATLKDEWIDAEDQYYWGGTDDYLDGSNVTVYLEDNWKAKGKKAAVLPKEEYDVEFSEATPDDNPWAVGDKVTITITPSALNKNVDGKKVKENAFEIIAGDLSDKDVYKVEGFSDVNWEGTAVEFDNITVTDLRTGRTLTQSKDGQPGDYTVEYENNDKPGTATVIVRQANGNYSGYQANTFEIKKIANSLNDVEKSVTVKVGETATVALQGEGELTCGASSDASVATASISGTTLTVTGVKAGSATVDVTAAGDDDHEEATVTISITVIGEDEPEPGDTTDVGNATVTVPSVTYNGKAQEPALTVVLGGKTLAKTTDYTAVYSNNVNAGTATVVIRGAGSYKGIKTVNFTIAKAKTTITTNGYKRVSWTGKKQTIDLGAKASSGAALTYSVAKKDAEGTVKVKDGKLVAAKDFVGQAVVTISAAATTNYEAATATVTIKVSPANISAKATSANGRITVTWDKTASADRYQLQIADNKNFKNARTIKKNMTGTSKTIKTKITKGETYYVQVRACNKIGKTLYHSKKWSKTIKVTVR